MSGNPFRKQPPERLPASALHNATQPSNISSQDGERRSSKSKHVRIATPPPLSPDLPDGSPLIRRVSYEAHEGSPPPSPRAFAEAFPEIHVPSAGDSFGQTLDEAELGLTEEAIDNTRRNSQTASIVPPHATGGTVNPFQRTLASMEPTADREDGSNTSIEESEVSQHSKQRIDVDEFKKMLMNGTTDSDVGEGFPKATRSSTHSAFESYSMRDAPYASSQAHSLQTESMSPTASPTGLRPADSTDVATASEKRPKPPPPKQRRGKPIDQPRIPQTVSFSDFAPTETPEYPSKASSISVPSIPHGKGTTEVDSSVPLPSLDDQAISQPVQTPSVTNRETAMSELQTSEIPQRRPPPPPLARRSSQPKAQPSASENTPPSLPSQMPQAPSSTSSLSLASEPSQSSKPPKAPPPPPTRRPGTKQAPVTPDAARSEVATTPLTDDAPVLTSSRSSSIASRNQASIPPPPPPPRRRDSSKSSSDQPSQATIASMAATSSEKLAGDSEAAIESDTTGSKDPSNTTINPQTADAGVLAEMDRLRAEVEALKRQYGRNL